MSIKSALNQRSNLCCHTSSCDSLPHESRRGKAFSECFALAPIAPVIGLLCRRVPALCAILLILLLTITIIPPAQAYWPVGISENLPVAAEPDTAEWECRALPLADNSIAVFFRKQWYGPVYQIIDKYGELIFDQPQSLFPEIQSFDVTALHAIPDEQGGVVAAWEYVFGINPNYGIRAQRIDSLGNLVWGNEGVLISPYIEDDFDICADGEGGIFLGVSAEESDFSDLYAQHIDEYGNLLWDETGVPVCTIPNEGANFPELAPDGNGGLYIVWVDGREPYTYNALFCQHLDSSGNTLWNQDLFIREAPSYQDVIPDGEGGCIVYGGSMYDGDAWRVDSQGNILWQQEEVTWYVDGKILPGEPGYFYFGFTQDGVVYGQRMDIDGNFYWPHGSPYFGAEMWDDPDRIISGERNWHFYYPYFYTIFGNERPEEIHHLTIQVLDTLGNKMLGDLGVDLTILDLGWSQFNDVHAIPSDNGIVGVFHEEDVSHNIWAKRCDWNGNLGGPNTTIEEVTISVSDNDIVLNWPRMSPNAEYQIYKSDQPYSFPAEPDTSVADTVFVDEGAVNEGTGYYNVRWEPLGE